MTGILGNKLAARPPSLTELIVARAHEVKDARTLRESLAARRKAAKTQQAANALLLPGL